jgi:prohibitin 1
VLSRPNVDKLPEIYESLGADYRERTIPSFGNEVLKAVVARYNADQLLTQREEVSREIREALTSRCRLFNLEVDDVSITHLNFSSDFAKAIEAKQVAEQMAERAKFVVAKAEQEKLALIVRSEGDAAAASLVSDALAKHGQGLIELRRIEAAQGIAEDLARNRNITYVPGGNNMLLNLPAGQK